MKVLFHFPHQRPKPPTLISYLYHNLCLQQFCRSMWISICETCSYRHEWYWNNDTYQTMVKRPILWQLCYLESIILSHLAFTCSKSTMQTPERFVKTCPKFIMETQELRQWHCFILFIIKFKLISHIVLVFSLLTLNK